MQALKANTNLVWCGFYLGPAPSHHSDSWMTQRAQLQANGWGLAPLYVGQQIIGPGSHNPSTPQGVVDGHHATQLMTAAGFPQGACVYLDLENGLPFPPLLQQYTVSWIDTVQNDQFRAGVYCSHAFAEEVHVLRPSVRIWAFKVTTTQPHPVPGPPYPDTHPAGSGYTGAYIWQLGQDCQISPPHVPGGTLTVDLDTAVGPDPSAP